MSNAGLLEFALDAVRRGLAVHPCKGKEPAHSIIDHGCKSASKDPVQIAKWWIPGAQWNVGVTAGVVLDIDTGLNCVQDLKNFCLLNDLPQTLAVRTGGRPAFRVQLHYSGTTWNSDYEANHCTGEIRGAGMYGMWCGSVHPISGEKYQLLWDLPVAEWSDDFLRNARKGRGNGGTKHDAIDSWTARDRFFSLLYRAARAVKGERHTTANNVCYFAARAFLAGVFEEEMFNGVVITPALTEKEVKQKIYNAVSPHYKRGERNVEYMLRASWNDGISHGRLELDLYPEDFAVLQSLSDDLKFQHAWDADTSDFGSAVEAKNYMEQALTAAGCADVLRVLHASRIFEATASEFLFNLKVSQIISGSVK